MLSCLVDVRKWVLACTTGRRKVGLMMPTTTRVAVLIVVAMLAACDGSASSLTISYLQQASDRYQKTVDVYTIADGAGSHFAARGEFDSVNGGIVPPMDEISLGAPCPGITCITA